MILGIFVAVLLFGGFWLIAAAFSRLARWIVTRMIGPL